MEKYFYYSITLLCVLICSGCSPDNKLEVAVFETSANGNKLTALKEFNAENTSTAIKLLPDKSYQTITGFGGSFTEASAYLLNQLGKENRQKILEAYFGENGAKYSLTRTHINSCDFSLSNYSYAPEPGDKSLQSFSNNWVDGWVGWNMVLDRQGGPNWFKNWCVAPVIVDPEQDAVYFTPIYHTLAHFSKYIRPGAKRIGLECADEELMVTAAKNPDGTIAVVVLNQELEARNLSLQLGEKMAKFAISGQAIQTIVIPSK